VLQNLEIYQITTIKVWYRHGGFEELLLVKKGLHLRKRLKPFLSSGKKELALTFVRRKRCSYRSWRGTEVI
jgi:hypothetical protein